jgi:phosphatidylserine decarboxylase
VARRGQPAAAGPEINALDYASDSAIELARGAEMGRFLLGSTVVLLWPRGTLRFNPDWAPGGAVRMGQALGKALG